MGPSETEDAHKGAAKSLGPNLAYSDRPNTTNATIRTVAVAKAASNVLTNANAILAGLGQPF